MSFPQALTAFPQNFPLLHIFRPSDRSHVVPAVVAAVVVVGVVDDDVYVFDFVVGVVVVVG